MTSLISVSPAILLSFAKINVAFVMQGSEPVVMMLDGNGALYPIGRDCVGMVREPPPLNLPPARALAAHALPLHPHGAHHTHHTALKSQVSQPNSDWCLP